MTVTIRPAQPDEYAAIGELTIEAYRADGQLASELGYAKTLRDVAGRARTGHVLVAVAVDGDRLLGSVTLVLSGSEYAQLARAGEAEFRMLAVDPAAQGRGVGEALVNACLDRAAARGCTAVVICTRDFAKAAQRLYARMGFERVPEKDWSPGPGVDLLALRYQLADRLW